jgi:hypothetical protein
LLLLLGQVLPTWMVLLRLLGLRGDLLLDQRGHHLAHRGQLLANMKDFKELGQLLLGGLLIGRDGGHGRGCWREGRRGCRCGSSRFGRSLRKAG